MNVITCKSTIIMDIFIRRHGNLNCYIPGETAAGVETSEASIAEDGREASQLISG